MKEPVRPTGLGVINPIEGFHGNQLVLYGNLQIPYKLLIPNQVKPEFEVLFFTEKYKLHCFGNERL